MSLFSFLRNLGGQDANVPRLSPAEFKKASRRDAVIIDVRTPGEFASGHVKGARNMDMQAADFRRQAERLDRNRSYYLYCRSGNRSGKAGQILRELGFQRVFNVGGIEELQRGGIPVNRAR
jgi:phage shock protein E